jgi:hypothetical protein
MILKVCPGVVRGGGVVGGGVVATATGMLGFGKDIGVDSAVGLPGDRVS